MSSDYFCSRHMDKGKRVSWKVGKGAILFTLLGTDGERYNFVFRLYSSSSVISVADARTFIVT